MDPVKPRPLLQHETFLLQFEGKILQENKFKESCFHTHSFQLVNNLIT